MSPRYAIDTLHVPGVPVYLTVGDQEALGYLKLTATGRPVYRLGTLKQSIDLPRHARPHLWRPAVSPWPEPLPEAATVTQPVRWSSRKPDPAAWEPPVNQDTWPFPDLKLGRAGVPPASSREAIARALRGIRTFSERYRDRPPPPSVSWPRDLLIEAHVVWKRLYTSRTGRSEHLRPEDYNDIWVDRSNLDARPARWEPTRRDIADVEDGGVLDWMRGLPHRQTQILRLRAALPPYSWRQIAEYQERSENDVRADYARACETVWRQARYEQADARR